MLEKLMTMTDGELGVLHDYMDKSLCYMEFGAGESTQYAVSKPSIRKIDCIESSSQFLKEHVLNQPGIAGAVAGGRLKFHTFDFGKMGNWGHLTSTDKKHMWPAYSLAVFAQPQNPDLVLIDGRFRVATTLSTILNTPEDTKIIIHDFWNRPRYHILLKFLAVETRVDTLGVFRKKKPLKIEKMQSLLRKYQYLPKDKNLGITIHSEFRKLFSRTGK
jgi:hypothetical protein